MNSNNPPFAIGQKVVCVYTFYERWGPTPKNGKEYIVEGCYFSEGWWFLHLEGFDYMMWTKRINWNSIRFRPVSDRTVEISASIIEQAKETIGVEEKIFMPETVNN